MNMTKILVVDDDKNIQTALSLVCKDEDFVLVNSYTISESEHLLETDQFDLILLDVYLPDGNGFDLLKVIRNLNIYTPVILLSSQDDEAFKVTGLTIGADDYITKPFSINLLKSKIKALIRRNTQYTTPNTSNTTGIFVFDYKTMTISKNGIPLDLTSKELQILKLFIENENQVLSKEQIYTNVWNNNAVDNNTITVYIKRIREKIEDNPAEPKYITNVWGIGYQFKS